MADTETLAAKTDIDDITEDMLPKLTREILEVSKVTPKRGETPLKLTKRAALKLTDQEQTSNDDWEALSDEAQRLINNAILCMGEKEDPELLLVTDLPDDKDSSNEETTTVSDTQTDAGSTNSSKRKASPAKADKSAKGGKADKATKAAKGKEVTAKDSKAGKTAKGGKTAAERVFGGRGRGSPFPIDSKIKVVEKNPGFREGTVRDNVYRLYKSGMTVGEAREAGVPYNHMRWHVEQGWVEIK